MPEDAHRSGVVALVGRPNAGKSTLLNRVLGEKLAITSPRPQTTRNRIVGIHTRPDMQVVLLDTPGIHEPGTPLNRAMVRLARTAVGEADAACWVFDAERAARQHARGRPIVHPGIEAIARLLEEAGVPTVVAANKIDLVKKPHLLPIIDALSRRLPAAPVIPISALAGDGVDALLEAWRERLPEGPPLYPPDHLTTQPERFVVAELIREKIFRLTRQEVPYATAVIIERFEEEPLPGADGDGAAEGEGADARGRVVIFARILVERPSQKGIVIGKGGRMLKRIGTEARKEIMALLGTRVHLDLHVSVRPRWSSDPRMLRELGIDEG